MINLFMPVSVLGQLVVNCGFTLAADLIGEFYVFKKAMTGA